MDVEKIKKWLEITGEYQNNDFWTKVLEQKSPEQFFKKEKKFPLCDVYKNETHICIIIELPGVSSQDIHISLQSRTYLFIQGIVKPLFPAKMDIKKERFYGEFERKIPLPEPTDAQLVQVHFHQGIIQVIYPRQIEPIKINPV